MSSNESTSQSKPFEKCVIGAQPIQTRAELEVVSNGYIIRFSGATMPEDGMIRHKFRDECAVCFTLSDVIMELQIRMKTPLFCQEGDLPF